MVTFDDKILYEFRLQRVRFLLTLTLKGQEGKHQCRCASTPLRYALASSCLFIFWFAYYFFNNKVVSRSAFLAGIDTVEYMGGYLIVSYFLLPRFILHKNIFYFIGGLMLLVLLIGTMRMYEYKMVSALYHQPYAVTSSSLVYVFTTTTFI